MTSSPAVTSVPKIFGCARAVWIDGEEELVGLVGVDPAVERVQQRRAVQPVALELAPALEHEDEAAEEPQGDEVRERDALVHARAQ